MEKKLSDLTLVELKALAYDQMVLLDQAQNNLRFINQEFQKRSQQQQNQQNSEIEPIPPGSIQRL